MASEYQYGAGDHYGIHARVLAGLSPGTFVFSEKFYESNDPNFDALLLLGVRVSHSSQSQDVLNSFAWRGFSKKGRAISRVFVKTITCTYSIPSFMTLQTYDYTTRYATIGTVDYGMSNAPDLSWEGILAEFVEHTGYDFKEYSLDHETSSGVWTTEEFSGYRVWMHHVRSPLKWEYPDLETTLPLVFTHRTGGYEEEAKPGYVFWKLVLGVRFMGSEKSAKHVKKIELGGVVS